MTVDGYQIYGSAAGSTALLPPVAMCDVHRSCTADVVQRLRVGYAFIASAYVLISWSDLRDYDICTADVTRIRTEGR